MEPGSIMWKCEQYDVLKDQLTAMTMRADENRRKYETQCVGTKSRLDEIQRLNCVVVAQQQQLTAMTEELRIATVMHDQVVETLEKVANQRNEMQRQRTEAQQEIERLKRMLELLGGDE